ncbi:SH3 domain-containing protein [Muricauda oceani]|uniref:SH3 domain-containing protein n=1 Tax=Flagellimonas oceani TaxID=2698672 RepID=A0A6G7J705_9FLAO|nr:SH3 domain-containing protein [Allomuricauda oceani]MBW8243049.1 SH3 domain-containing protein [Allomuricauda oceani]QII46596.1 SH3 domain-containing protein [Allomuricauda oceani]
MRIVIFTFFLLPIIGLSQNQKIEQLQKAKKAVLNNVQYWSDSLKVIQREIDKETAKYISPEDAIFCATSGAELRSKADRGSELISKLPIGTTLYVQEKNNNYYRVITEYGEGFVFQYYASKLNCPQSNNQKVAAKASLSSSPLAKSKSTNYTRKYSSSRRYIRGPRGGCYYINSNGNKTYVARSLCN